MRTGLLDGGAADRRMGRARARRIPVSPIRTSKWYVISRRAAVRPELLLVKLWHSSHIRAAQRRGVPSGAFLIASLYTSKFVWLMMIISTGAPIFFDGAIGARPIPLEAADVVDAAPSFSWRLCWSHALANAASFFSGVSSFLKWRTSKWPHASSSWNQLSITDAGERIRTGPTFGWDGADGLAGPERLFRPIRFRARSVAASALVPVLPMSAARNAVTCTVFPSPMSSARIPPLRSAYCFQQNATPSRW